MVSANGQAGQSVHAFASDPERGVFILGLLVFVIGGSLTLYAIRAPQLKGGGLFAPLGKLNDSMRSLAESVGVEWK